MTQTPTADGCASNEVLEDLANGRLAADARASLLEHLAWCGRCSELVANVLNASNAGGAAVTAQASLSRGARVGRYVVLEPLGAGGMGTVYRAFDPLLDRHVALKVLHGLVATAGRDLLDEARAMARISHPNVVPVHEVVSAGEASVLVMELVAGETLAKWLHRVPPPGASETVTVFLEAGRGLAHVHSVGLVHGDFKPTNVLVGTDGRVRVADFGLHQRLSAGPAPEALERPAPQAVATPESVVAGTPAYLAPERFDGAPASFASDQYSFCVALHEGLFGHRPGEPVAPPARRMKVSAALLAVVQRGLATDPTARWPSMPALLEALERVQRRQRRRSVVAAVATAVVLVSGLATAAVVRTSSVCVDDGHTLDHTWDSAIQASTRDGVLRSGVGYAAEVWAKVEPRLSAYATDLVSMKQQACLATRREGHQTEEVLGQRVACLEERKRALRVFAAELSHADAQAVEHAVQAAAALPAIADCADPLLWGSNVALPGSQPERERLGAVREVLARASAARTLAKTSEAKALAADALTQAQQLGYLPVVAEARYQVGTLEMATEHFTQAEAEMHEAMWAGEASGQLSVVASAADLLAQLHGDRFHHQAEAERWVHHADAVLQRLGRPTVLQLRHELVAGYTARNGGELSQATETLARAYAESVKALGEREPLTLLLLSMLAQVEGTIGHRERARTLERTLLEETKAAYGEHHPDYALALITSSYGQLNEGQFEAAVATLRRARAILDAAYGEKNLRSAVAWSTEANALGSLGRADEADAASRRAYALFAELEGPEAENALVERDNLATSLERTSKAEALREHLAVLELRRKALGPKHRRVGESLLTVASCLMDMGRITEALASYREALVVVDAALAPEAVERAYALQGLGRAYLLLHRPSEAIEPLTRALPACDAELLPQVKFMLAQALVGAHRDVPRAKRLAQETLELLGETDTPPVNDLRAEVKAWLARFR